MKTCILQTHSAENEALYQLTLPNHADYAGRHGYDMIQMNIPYAVAMRRSLSIVEETLKQYDLVFTVGSDVLFTSPEVALTRFLRGDEGVVISLEDIGGSRCNADTILWRSSPTGHAVIHRARFTDDDWKEHPWGLQEWFNRQYVKIHDGNGIRFAALREMQSTHVKGFPKSMWQPGDFALHFLGMSNAAKFKGCAHFLRTGEVMWRD